VRVLGEVRGDVVRSSSHEVRHPAPPVGLPDVRIA
jgi:hypothetical protein